MSGRPPRCPKSGCGRFLVWKRAPRPDSPGRWWCARCAKWIAGIPAPE